MQSTRPPRPPVSEHPSAEPQLRYTHDTPSKEAVLEVCFLKHPKGVRFTVHLNNKHYPEQSTHSSEDTHTVTELMDALDRYSHFLEKEDFHEILLGLQAFLEV